jgi:hypothetical protein
MPPNMMRWLGGVERSWAKVNYAMRYLYESDIYTVLYRRMGINIEDP